MASASPCCRAWSSAETLDQLAQRRSAAQRSRRDLRRINALMGTRRDPRPRAATRRRADAPRPAAAHPRAGRRRRHADARRGALAARAGRGVELDLLDRQRSSTPRRVAAYAELGWRRAAVADVFDWADDADRRALGRRRREPVPASLRGRRARAACSPAAPRRAERFVACEPRRCRLALSAATWSASSAPTR